MKIKTVYLGRYTLMIIWMEFQVGIVIETNNPYRSIWLMASKYRQGSSIVKFGNGLNQMICIRFLYFQFDFNLPTWIIKLALIK